MVIKKQIIKTLFLTLIVDLLCVNNLFAQRNPSISQTLKWFPIAENKISDNESISYFGFEGALYDYDNQKITPFFHAQLDWDKTKDADLQLVNVLTQKVENEELNLIDLSQITENYRVLSSINESRGKSFLTIALYPFVKNKNGEIHKILSFELQIDRIDKVQLREGTRQSFVNESVLIKGDWYKIGVMGDGIYKLTYTALKDMGIDIDNIEPDAINIFGNSFGMLPEVNNIYRPDDLIKNAIHIEGDGDGVFNSSDYILFYAKGPDKWVQNGNYFEHQRNTYSDTSYYFIQIDTSAASPKRITNAQLSVSAPTHSVISFNDFKVIQDDKYNLMKSGREWLGDHFDVVTDYSYAFNFPNMDLSSSCRLRAALAAKTPGSASSSFTINIPEASLNSTLTISGVGSGPYPYHAVYGNGGTMTYNLNSTSSTININLTFNKFSASCEAWTDFLEMNARRNLIYSGSNIIFRDVLSVGAGNVAQYTISNAAANLIFWEVTDAGNVALVNGNLSGSNYTFTADADTLRTFAVFDLDDAVSPIYFGRVANQNLHGLGYADILLVTHPDYLTQATELANFHQAEGLSVNLVTTNEIYNEFSSGMKDAAAIRMFFKMFYDRAAGDTALMPKYAILFGDGSYDNKYRLPGNTAFVPTYQSISYGQLYIISSFVSDDFYGMLDDTEGMAAGNLMDIAVGRINVRNNSEAEAVLKKIKDYSTEVAPPLNAGCCDGSTSVTMGDWRNWLTFVADDEDGNSYINSAEKFYDSINQNYPEYLIKKIYLDAYLQTSTPGGKRYYEAENDLRNKVQAGTLFVNYIGHGGEVGWAHERILDLATINNWTNSPLLPVFMTATCEFSRYDDPSRTSAGEYLLTNPDGGAIALMTTTRVVISGPNETLNTYFIEFFLDRAANNQRQRIGDFYLDSKNKMSAFSPGNAGNTRNFTLLGDPAVQFKIPFHNIITDSLNGVSISAAPDTIKALSVITIKGHVQDEAGNLLPGFNGIIYPVVFDKPQSVTSLANDPGSSPKTFEVIKNVIYKGKATVTNGQFQFTFVVPKDIAFSYGSGMLSYYAQNGVVDANGYSKSIIVGGANTNAPVDNTGPEMDIYMNDENFVDGGITNTNPYLIVKVNDLNGMNTVGNGIGHDLTAILDGNTSNTINLNEYYEADLDTYQSGRIKYQLTNLEPGKHTLKVKVWDVYNNSSEKEIEFTVQDEQEMALEHVLNYPNPFTTNTVFMFEHNQTCQLMDVKITIMTITGKIVKTILQTVNTEGFKADPIPWDGLDEFGDKLAIGTYIYKLEVKANEQKAELFEKLVILR